MMPSTMNSLKTRLKRMATRVARTMPWTEMLPKVSLAPDRPTIMMTAPMAAFGVLRHELADDCGIKPARPRHARRLVERRGHADVRIEAARRSGDGIGGHGCIGGESVDGAVGGDAFPDGVVEFL